jgi:hypothetical protein
MARERRTHGDQYPIYGCLFGPTPMQSLDAVPILLPTAFDDVPLPPLKPGTYCISATHLQGIYLSMWRPWRESWEERFQDRSRALALPTPLPPEEREPDAVLNGAILIHRLDEPTLQSLLQAGPPAQMGRSAE